MATSTPDPVPQDLETRLDRIIAETLTDIGEKVLYHYTTWDGVRGILKSQRFWATAHDCTNDAAELITADAAILATARELRQTVPDGAAAVCLDGFIRNYGTMKASKQVAAFLGCFSKARDDGEQWRRYGDAGRGLSVGIHVLKEPPPKNDGFGCWLIDVDYSEASWRNRLKSHFRKISDEMVGHEVTTENIAQGMSALYRIAAMEAVRAKDAAWSVEQEYRLVAVVSADGVIPKERVAGDRTIRYLETLLREEGKRIALTEIIIGPEQDTGEANQELERILTEAGYSRDDSEGYPSISISLHRDPTR